MTKIGIQTNSQFPPQQWAEMLWSQTEVSESLQLIFDGIDDAVIIIDNHENLVFTNPAAQRLFGDRAGEVFANDAAQLFSSYQTYQATPFHRKERSLSQLIREQKCHGIELFWQKPNSHIECWLKITARSLKDSYGIDRGSVVICRDITQHKQVEEQLLQDAIRDKLTGLGNRQSLLENLERAILFSRQETDYQFAILFLNINRFKVINDSLGHIIGDRFLIAIARRLENCLRSQDAIARFNSDEFVILLENIHDTKSATLVAERIQTTLIPPFNFNEQDIFAQVSIGIALSEPQKNSEELLRNASTAMHRAKKLGQSSYQIFNPSMQHLASQQLQLENDLHRAIERKELQLHYQPIFSLQTQTIEGFECLARWNHPHRGVISPSEFIPLAEETGSIVPLGIWVLQEACRQMKDWQHQFPDSAPKTIGVNISGKQILQSDFVAQIEHILHETKIDPHKLKLEITESVLIKNTEAVLAVLHQLQELGIKFSLDDFGTGYSSLSYLHQFPFTTLKIDRSFINSIDSNSEKLGIVRAIVALAGTLGMEVVAEGIETGTQLAHLKVLKCQYGQGYLFSEPVSSTVAETSIFQNEAYSRTVTAKHPTAHLEEQLSHEQLLLHIEQLAQELKVLKQDKTDLEILLDTTSEHAELFELELQEEIDKYQAAEAALQQANQELETLSLVDGLTEIANRRHFDDYLAREWDRLAQEQKPLSLILADVDFFKRYNDRYGHPAGDECLRSIAQVLCTQVKFPGDLAARYGGEEFAIILPNTSAGGTLKIAQRIRLALKQLKLAHAESFVSDYITLSLGLVSVIPSQDDVPKSLVSLADKALYEAKNQGRDRFILFSSVL
ncbi:diguanylate cyclase domain-containing protein [Lusitaniella coriacea]|uniref:diguanylate cyclase domain-containing protein n=1 Tax=Lusitaniella coriacea TaxID=1983105 RepID=UPI003CEABF36